MKSRINQIITLDDNSKYLILDQGIYLNKNYFLVSKLSDTLDDLTNHFSVFEETKENNKIKIKSVLNKDLLEKLFVYFENRTNLY